MITEALAKMYNEDKAYTPKVGYTVIDIKWGYLRRLVLSRSFPTTQSSRVFLYRICFIK